MMVSVAEIADRLNATAPSLAPELLPNGHRSGNLWMASGIADTGSSASLAVHLSGTRQGHWTDYGNAPADEERGDMIDLIRLKLCGGDMPRAVAEAKRRLGINDAFVPGPQRPVDPAIAEARVAEARARAKRLEDREAATREVKSKRARALWLSGSEIAGTPVEAYLRGRSLSAGFVGKNGEDARWPGSLRFHAEVWHAFERVKVPAMLAGIFDASGRQIGTHRTYLQCVRGTWGKLSVGQPKLVTGCKFGGFVPINKGASGKSMGEMPEGEPVYATEGIEDALTVRMMKPAARIVCAIDLGNIGAMMLPERARTLIIVADRDDNDDAVDTLERAIARQQGKGMRVETVFPPAPHKDVNGWWQAIAAGQERQRA